MDAPAPIDTTLTLDVFSDVVCPWCYLGKHRLDHALSLVPAIPVEVRWRPFLLDPTIPAQGMSRREYLEQKFGSVDAVASAHRRLVEDGEEEGIAYRFERIKRSPNSLDAHRLVRWTEEPRQQADVVERLFRAYFTEGRDVGDRAVLADIAGEAGLDEERIAARLATDDDLAAVRSEIDSAYRMGVNGVPCFVLDRRYAIMGAQPPEAIANALSAVAAERAGGKATLN